MEKEERFLPIGTVVLLKGGKRELMITSYCIMPSGEVYDKNGKVENAPQMYDYGACFYPEGMVTSDQLFAFNHDQIDRVCFKGYVTDNPLSYMSGWVENMEHYLRSSMSYTNAHTLKELRDKTILVVISEGTKASVNK